MLKPTTKRRRGEPKTSDDQGPLCHRHPYNQSSFAPASLSWDGILLVGAPFAKFGLTFTLLPKVPAFFIIPIVSAVLFNHQFAPMAVQTAGSLVQVISGSRTRAKKKSDQALQACADNALSALVNILTHHQSGLGVEMWSAWLQGLPCQQDEEEGKRNHKLLVQFAFAEKPEVLGPNGANVPQT